MPDDAKQEAEVIDVKVDDVLPPTAKVAKAKSPLASVRQSYPRAIARLLDELITLPNSKFKIGLDPIIGFFFPFVGDAVSATLGTTILIEGARRRVPKGILIRMAINIGLNATLGSLPLVGDLFSLWFKSNAQNNALLERHSGNLDQPKVRPNLWLLLGFLLTIFGAIAAIFYGLYKLARWIT